MTESLLHARERGYDWIEKCDQLWRRDREYAYVQMRLLARELLSQLIPDETLPSDNHEGGHDEEPDESPQRELHDGDAEQRDEAPVSGVRSQERDEPGGRRVLPLDSMPVVPVAHGAERDVGECDHAWRFDGDDPYIICARCKQRRDALSGRVVAA